MLEIRLRNFLWAERGVSTWNACVIIILLILEESGFVRELVVLDLADHLLDGLVWSILELIASAVFDTPVLIHYRSAPCAVYSSEFTIISILCLRAINPHGHENEDQTNEFSVHESNSKDMMLVSSELKVITCVLDICVLPKD